MIETVVSMEMPVGERLLIQKNRIEPEHGTKGMARAVIVTGTHGDELEGQFICYELARIFTEGRQLLNGIIDLYPALNPMGIDCVSRMVPQMEMDMNRNFPGSTDGNMMDQVAAAIVDDMMGADICLDLHASDTFVREIPQVRVSQNHAENLLPFAKLLNTDMIWMNATATVHESTLAHSLNMLGVPTLVIESGLGNRINQQYGRQIVNGILNLLHEMGMWRGEVEPVKKPLISTDGEVEFIRADTMGVFLPQIENDRCVKAGDTIGVIVDALRGTVKETIQAKNSGLVFTLREYPMVYEGALIARILSGVSGEKEDLECR